MPAGLQVFNDSGTVQITQDYSNLQLVTKGKVTISDTYIEGGGQLEWLGRQASFSVRGNTPIFCFKSQTPIGILSLLQNGQTWTVTVTGEPGTATLAMRGSLLVLLLLAGCTTHQAPAVVFQTPPPMLLEDCAHAPRPTGKTIRDLAQAL